MESFLIFGWVSTHFYLEDFLKAQEHFLLHLSSSLPPSPVPGKDHPRTAAFVTVLSQSTASTVRSKHNRQLPLCFPQQLPRKLASRNPQLARKRITKRLVPSSAPSIGHRCRTSANTQSHGAHLHTQHPPRAKLRGQQTCY